MADLSVTIGGDSSDLDREIRDVEKQLQTLERRRETRVRIGADVGDLDRRISDTSTRLNQLRTTANSTAPAMDRLSRSTANGSNTLTQFSRIAQDAPFGIMGIGNNLTATAEAFANLSQSAGGSGNALRAVASSLLGTGGILLAVSLVTTALTYMSQQGLTVGDVFRKISGDFDEARQSMQELNAEVAKNAQEQISSVGAYVSVAKDINLSMSDRLIAVKKLQDEYPAYFGNLTKEAILNGNVAGAVRDVTLALINKAKASAYIDKIVLLAEEEEKIQSRINNEILRQVKLSGLSNKEAFIASKLVNQYLKGQISLGDVLQKNGTRQEYLASIQADALLRSNTALNDLGEELRNNIALQDSYTKRVNQSTAASIKLEATKEKASKKTYSTPQVQGLDSSGLGGFGIIEDAQQLKQTADGVYELENNIKSSLGRIPGYFDTSGQQALLSLQKFNADMSKIIEGGIVDTLAGLGNAIGSALATGSNVLEAVGKTLLSSLGNVLTELGKMAIQTGIGILAIQTALKTLNPYVAIAAGVALVALGGAVTSSVQGLGSSGGGSGSYSSGRDYKSPVSSSSFGSSSAGGGGGTVVFEIDGQKLVGVLSNTLDKNSRLGGNLGLNS